MRDEPHLRHLDQLWAEDGPLQALRALAAPEHAPPQTQRTKAVGAKRRQAVEWLIETLIEDVDKQDGDPDLEPSADVEPALGWSADAPARPSAPWASPGGNGPDGEV